MFSNNQILISHNQNTPCKEIFLAVCEELSNYYVQKGFKYAKSRPKLTLEKGDNKLEIAFFSSRSNIPGNYVNLEIIPNIKSKINPSREFSAQIWESFFIKSDEIPPKMTIKEIFGGETINTEYWLTESSIREHNCCNVYGITEENFGKIITFIDEKIIKKFELIITKPNI
jgi:hypothetical protein